MTPYYQDNSVTLHHGDCLDVLRGLPDNSVDAVVCDPPYGLANTDPAHVAETITRWVNGERDYLPKGAGFMGAAWDAFVPPVAVWDDCMRVLKPGGHALVFAGSRTMDLMTLAMRLAGFEIRDSIAWLYGSGFPKSLDVSKAIDKQRIEDLAPAAAVARWLVDRMTERDVTRRQVSAHFNAANAAQQWTTWWTDRAVKPRVPRWEQWQELRSWLDLPDDMDAEVWRLNGRKGKPGDNFEAREVLSERVTVVEGGNGGWSDMVNSGRFRPGEKVIQETAPATDDARKWAGFGTALKPAFEPIVVARKPLNGTVAGNVLTWGTGALNIDATRIGSTVETWPSSRGPNTRGSMAGGIMAQTETGAAPAGRWPANVVLDESQARELDQMSGNLKAGGVIAADTAAAAASRFNDVYGEEKRSRGEWAGYGDSGGASRFFYVAKAPKRERPVIEHADGTRTAHPTVKPIALMRWLVRLVTPPGGTILEPFAGSGTTIEAALLEGFNVIGIEREAEYLPLIEQRIARCAAIEPNVDPDLFDLLDGGAA